MKSAILLLICCVALVGCNDMREIDERGMVLGVSLDQGEEKNIR